MNKTPKNREPSHRANQPTKEETNEAKQHTHIHMFDHGFCTYETANIMSITISRVFQGVYSVNLVMGFVWHYWFCVGRWICARNIPSAFLTLE